MREEDAVHCFWRRGGFGGHFADGGEGRVQLEVEVGVGAMGMDVGC